MIGSAPLMWAKRILISKHSRRRRMQVIRGIVGVSLSLIPFFVAMVMVEGMTRGISDRYTEIHTYHYQVTPYSYLPKEQIDAVVTQLQEHADVRVATAIRESSALLIDNGIKGGVVLRGVEEFYPEYDRGFSDFLTIDSGEFLLDSEDTALISTAYAEQFNLSLGDSIQIVTPLKAPNGKTFLKKSILEVRGTFSMGYQDLGKNTIYLSDTLFDKLFPRTQQTIGLKLHTYGTPESAQTLDEIRNILGSPWRIISWMSLEPELTNNFNASKQLLQVVMVLIFLIASINISTTILFVGLDSQADITLMMIHGVPRRTMGKTFLCIGGLIGVVGSLIGVVVGVILSLNITPIIYGVQGVANLLGFRSSALNFYLTDIPVILNIPFILLTLVGVVLLALLFSLIPARKISKQSIQALLRKR